MNTKKQDRGEWIAWLRDERHISESVMIDAGLGIDVSNGELVIPVFAADGTFLFNKYRKSPWTRDGAKYRYETGSKASLFGAETLAKVLPGETVLVTEGELDALALRTLGYFAVSTTGGAGTWKEEWSSLLKSFDVVFVYDADKAGIEGMIKASSLTPESSIAWIPVQHGKDPTDIIHAGYEEMLKESISAASKWKFPHPEEDGFQKIKKYTAISKKLREERLFVMSQANMTPFHIDIVLMWIGNEMQKIREEERKEALPVKNHNEMLQTEIERARLYPIKNLIKVNREKKAQCLVHADKNPSMHVYADHAFCFPCGKRFSAIDLYMIINKCDFKTAVSALQS